MTVPRCIAQARAQRSAAAECERQLCVDQVQVSDQVRTKLELIVERARLVMKAPVANIAILGADKLVSLATAGAPSITIEREMSLCTHMVPTGDGMVITDMTRAPWLSDHPYIDDKHMRAYCGLPLVSERGSVVGGLCVIDTQSRSFTDEQLAVLQQLAHEAQQLLMPGFAAQTAPTYGSSAGELRNDPLMQWLDENVPTIEQLRERYSSPRRLFGRRVA